jgi:hypothetical protein
MWGKDKWIEKLIEAVEKALRELLVKTSKEQLYVFALYTHNEDDYQGVSVVANTEEGLRETAHKYAEKDSEYGEEGWIYRLRWSVGDWKYLDFSPEVASIELPDLDVPERKGEARDKYVYNGFIKTMKEIEKLGVLKDIHPRVTQLVVAGDMSVEYLLKGMKLLNQPEFVDEYIEKYTPYPFLAKIESLPTDKRLDTLFGLYRDLRLGRPSALALDAKAHHVGPYDPELLIVGLGNSEIVSRLLDLIEQNGFGEIFNSKGSSAYKNYGPFTPEADLATSAIFLVEKCHSIEEPHVRRIQEMIARRVALDRQLSQTTTLAENMARVLHQLRPKRFPNSQLNPKTNHLDNPDPFLPKI